MSDDRAQAEPAEEIVPDDDAEAEEAARQPLDRDRDLLGRQNSACRKRLSKTFRRIVEGFQAQAERSDDLDKWWNCYNCQLDDEQTYHGDARVYVPIIRDAVNARVTRFGNQLFPQSGRFIDCTSSDGEQPLEVIALANHYIRDAKLKTQVVRPLLRNGDIEGQYNLYIDWTEHRRQIVSRETHGPVVEVDGDEIETEGDPIEDVSEEDIAFGTPVFEVLHDSDVLVLPSTADSIEAALAVGGSVTIVRRWSQEKLDKMEESGEIRADAYPEIKNATSGNAGIPGLGDLQKSLLSAIGVRNKGQVRIVFETWTMLPLSGGKFAESGEDRLCRTWFAIDGTALGAKRNPYWNDRCPLLSVPLEKVAGVFKGKSQVEAVAPLQYEANDAANECADADHYAAMPIIARDPADGNAPLILNLAAVWPVDPNKVKFMEFPDLSSRATARIQRATLIVFQSLGVNPSMLPQQSTQGTSKANQARVAQEQAVDLLTTAEAVSVADEGILTPLAGWIVDLDHQFRQTDLTVRAYGEMGIRAEMIDVPPLQNRTRYSFTWCGAEQAKMNVAVQQQGTALINVARGLAPQLKAEGFELRLGPALERAFANVFGPMTAALMLVDQRRALTVDAQLENQLLAEGHDPPVHPLDQDAQHLQEHMKLGQETGDPHGNIRVHIAAHLQQLAAKNKAAVMQQLQAQGAQGVPGGAGPGVAGTPRPGAQPAPGRPMQQPAGAIHADQMPRAGVVPMPRRM